MTPQERLMHLEAMIGAPQSWMTAKERVALQETIDDLRHSLRPDGFPAGDEGSVRVKLAVAIAKYPQREGHKDFVNGLIIGAVGVDECDDEDSAMHCAIDKVSDENDGYPQTAFAVGWVEADIPRIPTIRGRVVESEVGK